MNELSAFRNTSLMNEILLQKALLANLENDMLKCDNKYRFIRGVVDGSIIVSNRKRADLFLELKEKGFTPFPKKKTAAEIAIAGSTDDADESEENDVAIGKGVSASDYDYLLSLAIGTLTAEKMKELRDERDKLMQEVEELKRATVKSLWMHDLDALESKFIEELNKSEKKWAENRQRILGEAKGTRPVQTKPRKNTKKASNKESAVEQMEVSDNTVTETDKVGEVKKPRGRAAAKKKAPVEKVAPAAAADEDDDDGVADLRHRLAAYNFDSSPDRSEDMETEQPQMPTKKKEPNRRTAAQKKPLSTVSETIDDDDGDIEIISDDDFELKKKKKKCGRKPANAKAAKPPLAGTKKRGQQANKQQTQKLITEVLKPAENSPEKKVRKMRASPFNKKSSSILGRTISVDEEDEETSAERENSVSTLGSVTEDVSQAVAPKARPQRGTRGNARYVISDDSESDDPVEDIDSDPTEDEDSDFDDED
ncbi:hypothetical protein DH2020_047016 [Rehmannia glutinosa]|uniref:DNA topoisomerase (ATP-hydrolyzing) n=1 Tax=Rehmannia glutinosa TaxID=99300 RepID=A0ABR0U9K3_REHGL